MNLYNYALSGLNSSQLGLETTSHNINNAATVGYSRQRVITSTAGATATGAGFVGRGVQVDTIERQYNSFLYNQMVKSLGTGSQISAELDQMSQVNDLFADRTVGITPALAGFFSSLNAAASKPSDPAVRQDLLGKMNSLVSQVNTAYRELQNQREGLNTQVSTTVQQINSYLERVNDLNQQIVNARATGSGQPPNDLLDQRDQTLNELNQLVGIRYYEQGDTVSITLESGQTLLAGKSVFKLSTMAATTDPSRTVVAYNIPGGGGTQITVELDDSEVSGGKLGGLLAFRGSLDTVQNQLGQMAVGLALSFNDQHRQGLDLNGDAGGDLFGLVSPRAISNPANLGNGDLTTQYTDANALQPSDYEIEFDGTAYTVTRSSDGHVYNLTPDADGAISFDGLTVTPTGVAAAGDSWTLRPTRDAAGGLQALIKDPTKLALADADGGTTNGNNGLELAKLQTEKVLGNGSMNLNEMFSLLVNNVGVQTQKLQTAGKAQANLITQHMAQHQSVSGVNLNEEYVSLMTYQEQYQASARIIDVASTLFDTLLGLRG